MPFDAPIPAVWIPVKVNTPEEGERVAVLNGVRTWLTNWQQGLMHPCGKYPVTHWIRDTTGYKHLKRPYAVLVLDNTNLGHPMKQPTVRKGVRGRPRSPNSVEARILYLLDSQERSARQVAEALDVPIVNVTPILHKLSKLQKVVRTGTMGSYRYTKN